MFGLSIAAWYIWTEPFTYNQIITKTFYMTLPVKHISISINRPKESVCQFASNPINFPQWLAFVKTVSQQSVYAWAAETDLGEIQIQITPQNELGVIDHTVTLPDGSQVNNALRVIQNNNGSEVIFSLFKMPEKNDDEFEKDAASVTADLETLKQILEAD